MAILTSSKIKVIRNLITFHILGSHIIFIPCEYTVEHLKFFFSAEAIIARPEATTSGNRDIESGYQAIITNSDRFKSRKSGLQWQDGFIYIFTWLKK